MTAQPFKFRHLDAIIGAFVIGGVGVVITALLLVGHARQMFTSKTTIAASSKPLSQLGLDPVALAARRDFHEDLVESLRPGTAVELGGSAVGVVESASLAADYQIDLKIEIDAKALKKLRSDARLVIKMPLAPFMGQTRVVIKPGTGAECDWDAIRRADQLPRIDIDQPRDSQAMVMSILRDAEANIGPMLAGIRGLMGEAQGLLVDIRGQRLPQQAGELVAGMRERQVPQRLDALLATAERIAARAEATAAAAQAIADGLAAGKGPAGRILTDEAMAKDLTKLAADLQAISAEIRRAAPAIPQLADGGSTLLSEVQRLVDGLNRHWLLRAYTGVAEPERIVPPGVVPPPESAPATGAKP